jgi:predicted ester cyclase
MDIKELAAKDRRAVAEAFVTGNMTAFEETHAPDVVWHMTPFPAAKGVEANKQFITGMRQAFTDVRVDWDETVIEGNTIAHRFTLRMKHTGIYPAVPVQPTGKEVVIAGAVFVHVKNDKVVEALQYGDWLGMLQQLGAVPPMG